MGFNIYTILNSKRKYIFGGILSLSIVLGVVFILSCLSNMKYLARRASGVSGFKSACIACERYATDHAGHFPPLDSQPGRLMFDRKIMAESYNVTGKTVTFEFDKNAPHLRKDYDKNPLLLKNINLIDDHSMWYLGYKITDEQEGMNFCERYVQEAQSNRSIRENIGLEPLTFGTSPYESNGFFTANQSIPNAAIIPVFIERPGHYAGWRGFSGGWVRYLDGHSEFIPYPGKFPMTPAFIEKLASLDSLENATR